MQEHNLVASLNKIIFFFGFVLFFLENKINLFSLYSLFDKIIIKL